MQLTSNFSPFARASLFFCNCREGLHAWIQGYSFGYSIYLQYVRVMIMLHYNIEDRYFSSCITFCAPCTVHDQGTQCGTHTTYMHSHLQQIYLPTTGPANSSWNLKLCHRALTLPFWQVFSCSSQDQCTSS